MKKGANYSNLSSLNFSVAKCLTQPSLDNLDLNMTTFSTKSDQNRTLIIILQWRLERCAAGWFFCLSYWHIEFRNVFLDSTTWINSSFDEMLLFWCSDEFLLYTIFFILYDFFFIFSNFIFILLFFTILWIDFYLFFSNFIFFLLWYSMIFNYVFV